MKQKEKRQPKKLHLLGAAGTPEAFRKVLVGMCVCL